MSSKNDTRTESRSERGAILFIVAACLVVLLGFMGLAIDLGHAYNNKSQLQSIADACALAGASALNGETSGITLAETRATDVNNRLSNLSEFNKAQVPVPASAVTFSVSLNGALVSERGGTGSCYHKICQSRRSAAADRSCFCENHSWNSCFSQFRRRCCGWTASA